MNTKKDPLITQLDPLITQLIKKNQSLQHNIRTSIM